MIKKMAYGAVSGVGRRLSAFNGNKDADIFNCNQHNIQNNNIYNNNQYNTTINNPTINTSINLSTENQDYEQGDRFLYSTLTCLICVVYIYVYSY